MCLFLACLSQALAQEVTVTGVVTDASDGASLPGVNIIIEGTSKGTVTDIDGVYSIELEKGSVLIFSFTGYEALSIPVIGQTTIDVALATDVQALQEIVVVGYGTKRKSDLISSIASVKAEDMLKIPTSDIGEMLRGRAAGVLVTLGDAGPGSSSNILIRGKNSINGGNAPIVIADGVPVGSINDINPLDIASVEILKDAAAQAIYGARASNGVILITTKRGREGKINVNYSSFYGTQTVQRHFDTYSGEEFAGLKREAFRSDNNNQFLADEDVFTPTELEVLNSGEFIDWENEVLQLAPIQNHNVNISAGTEKTSLYASVNYLNQQGVVPGTSYEKATIRLNADQHINDWLKFGVNTSWQISENNDPGTGGTLQRTVTTSPLGKIYNDDGTYRLNPTGVQESFNPLLDLDETSNLKTDRNDIMNVFVDVSPVKGFNYRINASRRSWNRKSQGYSTKESLTGITAGGLGQGYIQFEDNVEWQLENILTYNKSIVLHNFGFTALQSITESKYSRLQNDVTNLPNDLLEIFGLESAQINQPYISANRRGLVSFAGRVEYDYDSRYYINLSARADASTVFGANNKWGYFPAIGLGWNVHQESFFDNAGALDYLKLRGSYGSVGNQAIDPYQSQSTADQLDYIFNGQKVTGYSPGSFLPNPDLRWETSTTLNLAVDFGIWNSRLFGTIEFYDTRTKDLLIDQALNAGLGYTRIKTNLGEIQNRGIELTLNGVLVNKKDVRVNAGMTFAKNNNKILSLYGLDEDGDGVEDDDVGNQWFIGYPIDVYYQYQPVGIYQAGEDIVHSHQPLAEPGDVKLFDRFPDDGELNADDRVITESPADWFGSFFFDANIKGFDLSANVITVQGVIRNNPYLYNYVDGGSLRGILNGVKQDYWTPENPTGNWPRPQESNDRLFIWTLGLQDASYFRLQNVTLGYSFNEKALAKMGLGKLRVYVTSQNPLTITDYQSYSPEKNPNDYPEATSVVGGIQVKF